MGLSTLCFAAIPVVMVVVGVESSPLWTGTFLLCGSVIGAFVYVKAEYENVTIRAGWRTLWGSKSDIRVILAGLSFFDYPILALAISLAGAVPAVIIYSVHPLLFVAVAYNAKRKDVLLPQTEQLFKNQLLLMLLIHIAGNTIVTVIVASAAAVTGESLELNQALGGILMGATLRIAGGILWRVANQRAFHEGPKTLGINSLEYFEPVVTLSLLALIGRLGGIRTDYLLIGAVAIVVANITLNGAKEIHPAVQAATVTLWGAGAVVYLRSEAVFVWERLMYWGYLGALAAAMGLMLAFGTQRARSAKSNKNGLSFKLAHHARRVRRNWLPFAKPATAFSEPSDTLVVPKRYRKVFWGYSPLVVFAVASCGLALMVFPDVQEIAGLSTDAAAALICSVSSYLVFDQRRLRPVSAHTSLKKQGTTPGDATGSGIARDRRNKEIAPVCVSMALGAAGVAFVLFPQRDSGVPDSTDLTLAAFAGIACAFICAVLSACDSFSFAWAAATWSSAGGVPTGTRKPTIRFGRPVSAAAASSADAGTDIADACHDHSNSAENVAVSSSARSSHNRTGVPPECRSGTANYAERPLSVSGSRRSLWLGSLMVIGIAVAYGFLLWDKWLGG